MNVQTEVDNLINDLEHFRVNQVKVLAQERSKYSKDQSEYWEITAQLCKEKARRLK